MVRFQEIHAGTASTVEGLDDAISAGLQSPAAADFSFPESGPAEPVQQVEAILILSSGGIPALLMADPSRAPILKSALDVLAGDFHRRLDSGETLLPGGIEYENLFRKALFAFQGIAGS